MSDPQPEILFHSRESWPKWLWSEPRRENATIPILELKLQNLREEETDHNAQARHFPKMLRSFRGCIAVHWQRKRLLGTPTLHTLIFQSQAQLLLSIAYANKKTPTILGNLTLDRAFDLAHRHLSQALQKLRLGVELSEHGATTHSRRSPRGRTVFGDRYRLGVRSGKSRCADHGDRDHWNDLVCLVCEFFSWTSVVPRVQIRSKRKNNNYNTTYKAKLRDEWD